MKSFVTALAVFLLCSPTYVLGHENGHKCACEAIEFDYEINCDDTATMLTALSALQTDGCSTDCMAGDCERNWLIVQTHHDYCPEDGVPVEIETGFHDFDIVCASCEISKMPVAGLPDCPAPNCDDNSGNTAYAALIADGCTTSCDAATCEANYQILRAVHDNCDHDTLSQDAEEGLHSLEEPCVALNCNSGTDTALTCDEDDLVDAPTDTSSASIASLTSIAAVAVAGIVM